MKDGNNYILRALSGGVVTAVGSAALIPIAAIAGQLLVVLLMHLFAGTQVNDFGSFFSLMLVSFICGLLSGLGVILVSIELWYLVKVMNEDTSPVDFFFLIAACQIGLYLSAAIFLGTLHEAWPAGALGLAILGLGWWASKLLRRRAEAAVLARMKEEGEAFCRELSERQRQRQSRFSRRRR